MVKCPNCRLSVPEVYPVDLALRDRIRKLDPGFELNGEMCKTCLIDLRKKAFGSSGVMMAQERSAENRKKRLWMSRVPLVRQGQALMANKQYNEAAAAYEKYLRVLELTFDCEPGNLSPESLKESAKTAELTVIVGAYWDLLRIYDNTDAQTEQQKNAATQLAKFINYTPVYPDIMKRAEVFVRQARHPEVVRSFISAARKKRSRCFIATSAFQSPASLEVQLLRIYRDQVLKQSFWGRRFVAIYYKLSPRIANFLDHQSWLKPAVRAVLRFVIKCVT